MSTPCTEQFYNDALYLLTEPQALHAIVSDDYETRWPDLTPPTLEQCEQFCSALVE